jgi:hypothetical protein
MEITPVHWASGWLDIVRLKMIELLIQDVNNGELIKKRSTPELTLFNLTIKCLSLMMKKLCKERQEYFKIIYNKHLRFTKEAVS